MGRFYVEEILPRLCQRFGWLHLNLASFDMRFAVAKRASARMSKDACLRCSVASRSNLRNVALGR